MELNEWFQKGMTWEEYSNSMTRNKQEMLSIYENFSLTADDKSHLEALRTQKLRGIVLTEDWCGDAMLNNPILMRVAEAAGMELRFVLRDQNLELMDQYLTNGTSRAIPIYIFINQEGEEVGVWGPRAPKIQELVMERRAALPSQDAEDFQAKQMDMYKQLGATYQMDATIWQTVADSLKDALL